MAVVLDLPIEEVAKSGWTLFQIKYLRAGELYEKYWNASFLVAKFVPDMKFPHFRSNITEFGNSQVLMTALFVQKFLKLIPLYTDFLHL